MKAAHKEPHRRGSVKQMSCKSEAKGRLSDRWWDWR